MPEKKHILVVEDEEHLAVGIKFNLEAEGYRVTAVGDGASALKLIEQDPKEIDLTVLDLMLPGMSGYQVCETLREQGNNMPVLILSARTLTEDRTRGFDVGADQYLNKPFDLDELLSRVKTMLTLYDRRAGLQVSQTSAATYSFANAVVNFDTYEVVVGGKPAKLTELEMKLLRYFIENEGRVIRREELLVEVWGMAATATTRAVDQFVRRLRVTFEPDPSKPRYFLTLRDAGYRFVSEGIRPTELTTTNESPDEATE
ncbi:MAG: response regulator transcription factor [Planctomycetaceae bacterium]|nr:response regulator transcription factor [Planctomycetales bacterium]MCB9875526.1 response regulator transcription factor [Planctomycetaceae bacterium]MCB9939296.1 response regulator transcription factor [Planctomycetaceae bacterium]HRX81171.1 response regulator transcription factor [Pirellulaceae bacterium]